MTFHSGEREMQRRAGVEDMAGKVGRMIHDTIPAAAADFLASRRMIVMGSRDDAGRVWASLVAGRPGFARAVDARTIHVDGPERLRGAVALLALDFEARKRMRLNGSAEPRPGGFTLHAAEVYSNCPKYIQGRVLEEERPRRAPAPRSSDRLSPGQQALIDSSDTFFIATASPGFQADVSHRGGMPGFVRGIAPGRLAWDDYPGNAMFNTLGNLRLHPGAGLLFVEFAGGRTLQLTGRALVIGDESRRVEFEIAKVVEDPDGNPFRWSFVDFSPFNPSENPSR
jgi:predicted pyridoxine 5'-phosphate oxidase superfamily flavin-nucleotide-binding protein